MAKLVVKAEVEGEKHVYAQQGMIGKKFATLLSYHKNAALYYGWAVRYAFFEMKDRSTCCSRCSNATFPR